MAIKAVIFDLFNTLVKCGNPEGRMIKEFNLQLDYYEVERISNSVNEHSEEKYAQILLQEFGLPLSKQNLNKMLKVFEIEKGFLELFSDSIPVLEELKKQGLKVGLISNSLPFLMPKLEEPKFQNLMHKFDVVILSEKIGIVKPNPKIFQMCIKKLKVKPFEALMVGDSLRNDFQGAEKTGMNALLLDRANEKDFSKKISSLNEIMNFLE